ncbi:hypothetical protein LTR94_026999 [Friedmanniomyces endolithicus]|nr:hypothetical protein LTR94_026999 [Friedmanniomyces endolithicus]
MALKTGDWSTMALMPTVVLVAYGSAWMIGAAVTRARWMSLVALVAYAGAVGVAWFVGSAAMYLVYLALLAATALAPGLYLMRREGAGAR